MPTHVEAFRADMSANGLPYSGVIWGDGKLHRFKCDGDTDSASWYVLFANDPKFAGGAYGCWRRGFRKNWHSNGADLDPEEKKRLREQWKQADEDRRTEEEKRIAEAKKKSSEILSASKVPEQSHPYLDKKKCGVHGEIRVTPDGALVLPLRDADGNLQSLQFIAADYRFGNKDRDKDFISGGKVHGCFYTVSDSTSGPLVICEGYATGASIHESTGWAVVCAMFAGNLLNVAKVMRGKFPQRTIVIAADNDRFNKENTGRVKAEEAAKSIHASVAVPEFADEDLRSSDFNDLASVSGKASVSQILRSSIPVYAHPIGELTIPFGNDPTELLKNRFLCQRMSLLFIGSTGKGKSSALLQALALFSLGRDFFGIKPSRPLTSLYIQAENDDGDIASIRDGICTGLNFTEAERASFFARVLVYTETALTGQRFCNEIVRPLLSNHHPDILAIDPALSYLGGDTKEQRDVGAFLRNYLNPLLFDFNCAAILNHHTNKINPKTKRDEITDFAYYGSGSAEWANWARAILALEATQTKGVFKLHAAKRGQKIGWSNEDGSLRYSTLIAHSKDPGVIYWREPDKEEQPVPSNAGRKQSFNDDDLISLIEPKSLPTSEWQIMADKELGISKTRFYSAVKRLTKEGRVMKSVSNGQYTPIHIRTTPEEE